MTVSKCKLEIAIAKSCMTTKQLSDKTKLTPWTITRIKNGCNCQLSSIGKIAKALNVSVEELIETAATVNQENGNV